MSPQSRVNVFISSTFSDLVTYRQAVSNAILDAGMHPIGMENFVSSPKQVADNVYQYFEISDAFIGIYAHRYGSCPDSDFEYGNGRDWPKEISFPHMEYLWAQEQQLPILIFLMAEDALQEVDLEVGETREKLVSLKIELRRNHTVKTFTTAEELRAKVVLGLSGLIAENLLPDVRVDQEIWRTPPLPKPDGVFTGRREDIEAITSDLERYRRVVIQGFGGVGKTSLAFHLGNILMERYPAGALWGAFNPSVQNSEFELSRIWNDWKQVTPEGRAINHVDASSTEQIRTILSKAPDRFLVIIDDVWERDLLKQVLDVLPPHADVIWTTRDAQLVRGIKDGKIYRLREMNESEAEEMLIKRLNEDNPKITSSLKELARLLGYHPLALDIAACYLDQVGIYTADDVEELIREIKRSQERDQFARVLVEGDERDDNLEAALALSYNRLTKELQYYFQLLGVVPSGLDFDRSMIWSIWDVDIRDEDALTEAQLMLTTLNRIGLVNRTPTGRFILHVNLRTYARRLIYGDNPDNIKPAIRRYNKHVLDIAKKFLELPSTEWKEKISQDYPHIHFRGNQLVTRVQKLLDALGDGHTISDYAQPIAIPLNGLAATQHADVLEEVLEFFYRKQNQSGISKYIRRQRINEGRQWLEVGLFAARVMGNISADNFFMNRIGRWYHNKGYLHTALSYYDLKNGDDEEEIAQALYNMGLVFKYWHKFAQAHECFDKALQLYEQHKNTRGLAAGYSGKGEVFQESKNYDAALEYYEEKSLPLRRKAQDRTGEATTLKNIGTLYADLEDWQKAREYYETAHEMAKRVGNFAGQANVLTHIGIMQYHEGNIEKSLACFEEALALSETVEDREQIASINFNMCLLGLLTDRKEVSQSLEKAINLWKETGSPKIKEAIQLLADFES